MSSAVQDLLDILDLEPLEVNLFRGRSPQVGWQRVFGGQVIGQALVAAVRTVEGRPPHSMHAYFLLPGDPKVPIIYDVDRIRDGKSFTTRRVTARQHGHPIFSMLVSFHADEPGLDHQAKMPDVPPPEKLPSDAEMREKMLPTMPDPVRRYYERERPIELRPVEFERYLGKKYPDGRFNIWIRTTGKLPDDPAIHQCVLAYASDMTLLDTALVPHGRTLFEKEFMAREPRSCAVAAPAVPRRRLAALCAGFAQPARLARLRARTYIHPRRHAGRLGRAGRPGAPAARIR